MEKFVAALKARLVPVNVNYRYREQELLYLLDNSDVSVVVYEASFAGAVAKLRDACPPLTAGGRARERGVRLPRAQRTHSARLLQG